MQRIALLESEKHADKAAGGSAASVALHVVVLAFAIAVTSHAGTANKPADTVHIVLPHWHPDARVPSQPVTKRAPTVGVHVPVVSVAVPTVIPAIIPPPAVSIQAPATFGAPSTPSSGFRTGSDTAVSGFRGDSPFAVEEVDVPASALPNQRGPAYPEALRILGVEGRVVARFIVGKNGRVESDPTIVVSTDDQFANAVKRYLASARYRAATKNGEPVRQLAEQEFDFAVRR